MTKSQKNSQEEPGKRYYIDERGFLVPKSKVFSSPSKKKRVRHIRPIKKDQEDDVYKRLRDEFASKKDPNVIELKLVWDHPKPSQRHHQCPFCSHHTRLSKLKKHLKEIHGIRSYHPSKKKVHHQKQESQDTNNDGSKRGEVISGKDDDVNYGGKNLGHMRRESGKFGSLPLYEDHSEESKP